MDRYRRLLTGGSGGGGRDDNTTQSEVEGRNCDAHDCQVKSGTVTSKKWEGMIFGFVSHRVKKYLCRVKRF